LIGELRPLTFRVITERFIVIPAIILVLWCFIVSYSFSYLLDCWCAFFSLFSWLSLFPLLCVGFL
jgi:hypothetical protein